MDEEYRYNLSSLSLSKERQFCQSIMYHFLRILYSFLPLLTAQRFRATPTCPALHSRSKLFFAVRAITSIIKRAGEIHWQVIVIFSNNQQGNMVKATTFASIFFGITVSRPAKSCVHIIQLRRNLYEFSSREGPAKEAH